MSDLMGRKLLPATPQVPYSLHEFADEEELPEADLYMLASIQFRGEQPRIKNDNGTSTPPSPAEQSTGRAPSRRENRRGR